MDLNNSDTSLEDLQRHVVLNLSHLRKEGENYFFDLSNPHDSWSGKVLHEINKQYLKDIGAHLVFARWIPYDLSFTRGDWAKHLPTLINERIIDKDAALRSIFLYGIPIPRQDKPDRFTLTDFILNELRKKISIIINLNPIQNRLVGRFDDKELRIDLPFSLFKSYDSLLSKVDILLGTIHKVNPELYKDINDLRFSDFIAISDTGKALLSNSEGIELSEMLYDLAGNVKSDLNSTFTEVGRTLEQDIQDDLWINFCFTTLKLCLIGRPGYQINEIIMFSFPHYNSIFSEDEKDLWERSLCCFFLYNAGLLGDVKRQKLREGLAYVSSQVAGAEYARLVQQASLRGGTRAAVTALSGRNLSHNTGSHILYWLEVDARNLAEETIKRARKTYDFEMKEYLIQLFRYFCSKELFYRYMRERMDLVAAFAVYLPMWTKTFTLKNLIVDIDPRESTDTPQTDGLVLRYIGKSEGVLLTDIVLTGITEESFEIPGAILGKQALYGIIENIARDAAKYGNYETDTIVLVMKLNNTPANVKAYSHSGKNVIHINNIIDDETKLIEECNKYLPSEGAVKRIVIVNTTEEIEENGDERCDCTGRRKLISNGNSSINDLIYWIIRTSPTCNHELCKLIRGIKNILEKENEELLLKKSLELDQALLSIIVEISEIEEGDLDKKGSGNFARFKALKDNFLRVKIWDDRTLPDEVLESAIGDLEREGLTDEEGRLRSDNWGVKERYIFASYLRGEKPESWLLPEQYREAKVNLLPILRVKEQNNRLVWQFHLLKSKNILVVSDNSNVQQEILKVTSDLKIDSDNIDLWSWKDLEQRINTTYLRHRFVILCPPDNDVDSVNTYIHNLPYRVFIYLSKLEQQTYGTERYPVIDDLDVEKINTDNLYDLWIDFLSRILNRGLPTIMSYGRGDTYGEVSDSMEKLPNFDFEGKRDIALFDRHGKFCRSVKERLRHNDCVIHYEPFIGDWPVERCADFSNKTFRERFGNFKNRDGKKTKYSMQEAALLRILIADERIDDSIDSLNYYFKIMNSSSEEIETNIISQRELWQFKGVDVIGKDFKGKPNQISNEDPIVDRLKNATAEGKPYGFLLIHQGILDKLYKKTGPKKTKEEFIRNLLEKIQVTGDVLHILIHSGRGGIVDLPSGVKFIHLSNVESWFVSNLSKVEVIEELMSIH